MKFLQVALLFALIVFVTNVTAANDKKAVTDGLAQSCTTDPDCPDMCHCINQECKCFRDVKQDANKLPSCKTNRDCPAMCICINQDCKCLGDAKLVANRAQSCTIDPDCPDMCHCINQECKCF